MAQVATRPATNQHGEPLRPAIECIASFATAARPEQLTPTVRQLYKRGILDRLSYSTLLGRMLRVLPVHYAKYRAPERCVLIGGGKTLLSLKMLTPSRAKLCAKITVVCLSLLAGTQLYGQSDSTAMSQERSSYSAPTITVQEAHTPGLQPQNPYLGGVSTGKASPRALSLSLEDALSRGLRQNLGGLLSSDAVSGAKGERWRALSALLPNLTTNTSLGVRQNDLKAIIGISVPGQPSVIGPFGVFDTRAYLDQSVFNWESIERERSSAAQVKAAQYSYKNARELIAFVVVSNYLLVIADQSRVDSALAQQDTAKALLKQTADQQKAGLAAAVDVLRANVELQARDQELIVARNNLAKQRLVLARAIGLPSGQAFVITTEVPYEQLRMSTLGEALQQAYASRPDYKSQITHLHAAEMQKKADSAERYPTLSAHVNYGAIGTNLGSSHGTVNAAVELQFPIFQGGRVHGDKLVADSILARATQRLEDMRASIDQQVRNAFLDLQDTAQEVSVEKNAVRLATQTLQQSRDRFASGVTDNIEVVQAQESLADANDAYIDTLYRYNIAKISIARAIGVTESNYAPYLKGQ